MKVLIKSRFSEWNFEKEIDYIGEGCCEGAVISLEDLIPYLSDDIGGLYYGFLADCRVIPRGRFDETKIWSFVCDCTRRKIEENREKLVLEVSDKSSLHTVNITDMLLDMLEDDSGTGEFDAVLSGYVENCLMEFVKSSSWHIEKDCLWFGGEDRLGSWRIDSATVQDDLAFWFEYDSWTVMEWLGNFTECFLIWYTAECGCWTPDMNEIREKCPIPFDKTDTVGSLIAKASALCEPG